MHTDPDSRERSVDHSARERKANTNQTWVNRAIQSSLQDLALNVGYMDGMVLDEFICKATEDGWLVIVKAHRNGRKRVAFVAGATFGEAMELAADFAEKGVLTWQQQKKPPWLRRRQNP